MCVYYYIVVLFSVVQSPFLPSYTVMSKRLMKLLVALVLTLMFTISLLKLVLLLWSTYPTWLYADIAPPNEPNTVDEWLEQQKLSQYKQLFRDKGKLLVVCVCLHFLFLFGRVCVGNESAYCFVYCSLVPRFLPLHILDSILLCKFVCIFFRQFSRLFYFVYGIAVVRWATNSNTLSIKLTWWRYHIGWKYIFDITFILLKVKVVVLRISIKKSDAFYSNSSIWLSVSDIFCFQK